MAVMAFREEGYRRRQPLAPSWPSRRMWESRSPMPRNDLTSLGRLGAKCCNLTSTRSRRHVPSHDSHRPVSLEGGGRVVPMRHEIRLCRLFRAEKGFPPSREALASAHHLDAACTCVLWLGANCGLRRWQATDGLSRVGLPLIPTRGLRGKKGTQTACSRRAPTLCSLPPRRVAAACTAQFANKNISRIDHAMAVWTLDINRRRDGPRHHETSGGRRAAGGGMG